MQIKECLETQTP